jgi:hypothetical protein
MKAGAVGAFALAATVLSMFGVRLQDAGIDIAAHVTVAVVYLRSLDSG